MSDFRAYIDQEPEEIARPGASWRAIFLWLSADWGLSHKRKGRPEEWPLRTIREIL
jgi:hypothetical protein